MRPGLHAKILLAVVVPAAVGIATAIWFESGLLSAVAAAIAALAGALFLSAAIADRIGDVEAASAQSLQQIGQRVRELTTDRGRTEAILSGMVEGVLVVDADGRLQLINDAARRMLNVEEIAPGRSYVEAVRHPGIVEQLGAALTGERRDAVEVPIAGRIFSARATPAAAAGGAVLVLHDISDLRRADRVRHDFVANVSHELRTPLTAVRGYVEALLEEPTSAEQRRKFLEVIARHTARMERLVRDLLRLARLDAQQEAVDLQRCDTEMLFRTVVSDLAEPIERQGIQIATTVHPEARSIQADPTKLHDALRNLIENAVNYSPEGGRVELEARVENGRAVLSVGDQGPGLPESDLSRVFERFYRVDKSRTRDPGGTGLGLSIVKHLIELHGGEVEVRNRPDGGAMFTIRLPRAA